MATPNDPQKKPTPPGVQPGKPQQPAAGKPAGAQPAKAGKPEANGGAKPPQAAMGKLDKGAKPADKAGDKAKDGDKPKDKPAKKPPVPTRSAAGRGSTSGRKLGQVLVDLGYIDDDQLWEILDEAKN